MGKPTKRIKIFVETVGEDVYCEVTEIVGAKKKTETYEFKMYGDVLHFTSPKRVATKLLMQLEYWVHKARSLPDAEGS